MSLQWYKAAALLAVLLALAIGSSAPSAASNGTSKHVSQRLALKNAQKAAMDVLTAMVAGRNTFDQAQARATRRQLIKSTSAIPKHFKKQWLDPRSNAQPLVWQSWDDFKARAEAAKATAKALNARSLPGLRRTLPSLIQNCISCHETYRSTPNSFTTH